VNVACAVYVPVSVFAHFDVALYVTSYVRVHIQLAVESVGALGNGTYD
jgi:hypothetical protein